MGTEQHGYQLRDYPGDTFASTAQMYHREGFRRWPDDRRLARMYRGKIKPPHTHHTDEQTGLLGRTPHTGIADDTNSEARGETGETDRETGAELDETSVEGHGGSDCASERQRASGGAVTVSERESGHSEREDGRPTASVRAVEIGGE